MANVTFKDKHIEIDKVPKRPKKLTGTRFATVMGLNAWSTPFEVWCDVTKTYKEPFEDTIYTNAGKVIEPKVVEYLKDVYFMDIKEPEDIWGKDYFKETWGDFYPDKKIFGGMWDAIGDDYIVEIKTTKRAEDWADGIPVYYKLQAALYAHLSGFDDVVVVVSFLEPKDYDKPEDFVPSATNTSVFEFKMSEDYPNFIEDYIIPAKEFYERHVLTGISPEFDERKDADIIKALRTSHVTPNSDEITEVLAEADELLTEINQFKVLLSDKEKRLKALEKQIKDYTLEQFGENDDRIELTSNNFIWTTSKGTRKSFNSAGLKKDNPKIYEQYMEEKETYTLRKKEVEKE